MLQRLRAIAKTVFFFAEEIFKRYVISTKDWIVQQIFIHFFKMIKNKNQFLGQTKLRITQTP